jgi:hypothetical protein
MIRTGDLKPCELLQVASLWKTSRALELELYSKSSAGCICASLGFCIVEGTNNHSQRLRCGGLVKQLCSSPNLYLLRYSEGVINVWLLL